MAIVELFGVLRVLGRRATVTASGSTIRHCLEDAERQVPALAGRMVADGRLSPAHRICLNGEQFVDDLELPVGPADAILVLAADLGG